MEGWRVAWKRLGPLARMKWAALGRGCGRKGSGALPLPRTAAVSTGLRIRLKSMNTLAPASPGYEEASVTAHRYCWNGRFLSSFHAYGAPTTAP